MPPDQYLRRQCLELAAKTAGSARDIILTAAAFERFVMSGEVKPAAAPPRARFQVEV